MPRVASLYLPDLATDRIRQARKTERRPDPASSPAGREQGPLVIAHRSGQRITIAAASSEARALGLCPGMALSHARALVPGLDIEDADPDADAAVLHRLGLFAARRWSPRSAISLPDGLWLDLEGVAHLFGGERIMCRRILRFCARLGLAARIAVAGTAGAASALARFGADPLSLCPSGDEARAIASLPIAALRLDGEALGAARRLGLDRIEDMMALPRAPLERRMGKDLLLRLDQALGRAAEPLDPIIPEERPVASQGFVEPIATAEAIAPALRELVQGLTARLIELHLGVRIVHLSCMRVDGEEQAIAIGTARATRDGDHLFRLLEPKIETIDPGFGIEAMRLTALRCEPLAPEAIAGILGEDRAERDLAPLVDRLAGRLGSRRLFRASAVESDVPERSLRRVGPFAAVTRWPRWPRPVRLLSPPERVDNVLALLPDQPPRRFTWRGRQHIVRQADGPERIYGEWWKRTSEAEAVRDYFQVEDDQGSRFWLYRRGDGADPRTGDFSWYLHGMFG